LRAPDDPRRAGRAAGEPGHHRAAAAVVPAGRGDAGLRGVHARVRDEHEQPPGGVHAGAQGLQQAAGEGGQGQGREEGQDGRGGRGGRGGHGERVDVHDVQAGLRGRVAAGARRRGVHAVRAAPAPAVAGLRGGVQARLHLVDGQLAGGRGRGQRDPRAGQDVPAVVPGAGPGRDAGVDLADVGPLPAGPAAGGPVAGAERVLRGQGGPDELAGDGGVPAGVVGRGEEGHPGAAGAGARGAGRLAEPEAVPAELELLPPELDPRGGLPEPADLAGAGDCGEGQLPQGVHGRAGGGAAGARGHVDQGDDPAAQRHGVERAALRPVPAVQRGVLPVLRAAEPGVHDELEQPGVHDRGDGLAAAVDVRAQQRDGGGVLPGEPRPACVREG
jgi:hypothetical protein